MFILDWEIDEHNVNTTIVAYGLSANLERVHQSYDLLPHLYVLASSWRAWDYSYDDNLKQRYGIHTILHVRTRVAKPSNVRLDDEIECVKVSFVGLKAFRIFVKAFETTLIMYEHQVNPIQHFLADRGFPASGWMDPNITTPFDYSKLRVLSFDIETYTPDVPEMPKSNKPDDIITFITLRIGELCICMGVTSQPIGARNQQLFGLNTPITTPRFVKLAYDDELGMLKAFFVLLRVLDPHVLVGYNSMAYDQAYISARCKFHNLNIPNCSQYSKGTTSFKPLQRFSGQFKLDIVVLRISGCICFDLMKYLQVEDKSLASYSLDFVARKHLKQGKTGLSASSMFKLYLEHKKEGIDKIIEYAMQDTSLVHTLMLDLRVMAIAFQKSFVTMTLVNVLYVDGPQTIAINAVFKYCSLVNRLFNLPKHKFIDKFDLQTASSNSNDDEDEDENNKKSVSGGFCSEPVPGIHEWVVGMDFASLYPNVMIVRNLCPTTLVNFYPIEDLTRMAQAYNCSVEDVCRTLMSPDTIGSLLESGFAIYFNGRQGLMPQLLTYLLDQRKEAKRKLKETSDPLLAVVYHSQQYSYKITANSMYGILNSMTCQMYSPCTANAVTATGRQYINQTRDIIEDTRLVLLDGVLKEDSNGEACVALYTDTDSCYFNNRHCTTEALCKRMADIIYEKCCAFFPLRIDFVYEDTYRKAFFMGKKAYAVQYLNGTIKNTGGLMARKAYAQAIKDTFLHVEELAFCDEMPRQKVEQVVRCVHELVYRTFINPRNFKDYAMKCKVTISDLDNIQPSGRFVRHFLYSERQMKRTYAYDSALELVAVHTTSMLYGGTPTCPQTCFAQLEDVLTSPEEYKINAEWYLGTQFLRPLGKLLVTLNMQRHFMWLRVTPKGSISPINMNHLNMMRTLCIADFKASTRS